MEWDDTMQWAKTTKYQTTIKVGRKLYNVLCESDFDDGFAVYINRQFVADIEALPTKEELIDIIADNNQLESTIKDGLALSGVFDERD
jgi:hypothetical protein